MLVGCVLFSALIWWLFARVMTAKTLKGARMHIAVLGFQEFMNRVDADRLKVMPPDTFEKFLPYAMALGVEHHWAQAFAGILKTPPTWYAAPAGYAYGTIQSNPLLLLHAWHGDRYASGICVGAQSKFRRIGLWRRRGSFGGGGGFSGGGFGGGGGSAF